MTDIANIVPTMVGASANSAARSWVRALIPGAALRIAARRLLCTGSSAAAWLYKTRSTLAGPAASVRIVDRHIDRPDTRWPYPRRSSLINFSFQRSPVSGHLGFENAIDVISGACVTLDRMKPIGSVRVISRLCCIRTPPIRRCWRPCHATSARSASLQ
jgi:hypothetical protein